MSKHLQWVPGKILWVLSWMTIHIIYILNIIAFLLLFFSYSYEYKMTCCIMRVYRLFTTDGPTFYTTHRNNFMLRVHYFGYFFYFLIRFFTSRSIVFRFYNFFSSFIVIILLQFKGTHRRQWGLDINICVRVRTCMCAYACTYVRVCARMCVCARAHVCVYITLLLNAYIGA